MNPTAKTNPVETKPKKRTSWIALTAVTAFTVFVIVVFYNALTMETESAARAAEANAKAPIFHR